MALFVNSNISALNAQRQLINSGKSLDASVSTFIFWFSYQ